MSGTTVELNLATAVDADDNADYLTISLANSLRTVDGLFNSVTGHTHGGAHQGGPVAIPDGSIQAVDIANGAVTNAKLASDTARLNLLTNGGFEVWQRGNGPFTANASGVYGADRWSGVAIGTDTLSVSRHTTAGNLDIGSSACAAVTFTLGTGAGTSQLYQDFSFDGIQLAGRTVTLSVRVKCSTPNAVRIALNGFDASSHYTYSGFHSGGGAYETLTVTATMSATLTRCQTAIFFAASCTAYIDNAMLVVGSVPADYAPLHAADELHRCQRYFELMGGTSGGGPDILGYAGTAGEVWGMTAFFKATKPVTPTLTKIVTWATTNCGQPTIDHPSSAACRVFTTVTGIGAFALSADVGQLSAEANV